ncbi:MAG: F0F1 ATP synthase subunit B [Acidobacteriota bacterium]
MEKLITPDIGVIFWTIVTFLVVLLFLRLFFWKPILNIIDEREKTIKESIDQADRARDEAERLLTEQQAALEKVKRETTEMLDDGRREAERVKAELIEQAKRSQEEIIEQGKKKIEQEARLAMQGIKEKVVDLAITAAGRLIEVSLDEKGKRKLVEDYLEELSRKKH